MQSVVPLKGILTEKVFDPVSIRCLNELILGFYSSTSVSFEASLSIMRQAISSLHLMLAEA